MKPVDPKRAKGQADGHEDAEGQPPPSPPSAEQGKRKQTWLDENHHARPCTHDPERECADRPDDRIAGEDLERRGRPWAITAAPDGTTRALGPPTSS